MTDENLPANQPPEGQFLLYQTEDGQTRIECRLVSETIWLTQRLMSDLFQVTVATINEHLKKLVNDGEIDANRTIRKFLIVVWLAFAGFYRNSCSSILYASDTLGHT